jgi:hypothetical protein
MCTNCVHLLVCVDDYNHNNGTNIIKRVVSSVKSHKNNIESTELRKSRIVFVSLTMLVARIIDKD